MVSSSLNLKLHSAQLEIYRDSSRVKVLCAGRGFGKSVYLLTEAIIFCLTYSQPIKKISPQIAVIVMPTQKMARQIHFNAILPLLENCPAVEKIDKGEMRVIFKGDKPDLVLMGADLQGDRLRGLNLVYAGCDEFQDFHRDVWPLVIEPALARNSDYKATIIGTPKGKTTNFYQVHLDAIRRKEWSYFHKTTFDNPYISREVLEEAELNNPPKVFNQEYRASWENFDGQIFSELNDSAKIVALPTHDWDVYIGVDFGDVNPACVVVAVTHTAEPEYFILDYWRNETANPIPEQEFFTEIAKLCSKYDVFRVLMPDDRTASILSSRKYGKKHSVKAMERSIRVTRSKPSPIERATIANNLFYQSRLMFGPNAHTLYSFFESYHYHKDQIGNITTKIADGQIDHDIDATLYVLGYVQSNRAG
jgi:hypothetical protein